MGLLYKGLFLASLLVVQVLGNTLADPCAFSQQQLVFEVKEILKCYESIPVDANRIENTVDTLHELIQTYSFTDIAMSNIPPYNVNVDLASALALIGQENFTGDYAFHMALSRLFNKLNDAHTMYYAPEPYRQCFGLKAFAVAPRAAASPTEDAPIFLTANPLSSKKISWNWPIDPTQFSGLQVVQINGQDPRDYLMKYSDHVGTYKDRNVRFNHLFDLTGWGVIDTFTFPVSDIPEEIVTVESAQGTTINITVPVKMFCSSLSYTNTKEFIRQIDTPTNPSKRSIETPNLTPDLRKERLRRIQHAIEPVQRVQVDSEMEKLSIVERFELVVRRLQAKRGTQEVGNLQPIKSVSDGSMHLLAYVDTNGNIVPVLKVVSFAPETEEDQRAWVSLALGFNYILHKFNFTYAIADVNKNGGGIICYTLLLQALVDQRIASVDVHNTDVLWTPYNMRKSNFFNNVYDEGIQQMDDDYLDMQTGNFIDPTKFYNAETHNISLPNDIQSELTKFVYFPGTCKSVISAALQEVQAWPKNLIITTDGSCGSACAAFMAKMTKLGTATIVAIGGDTQYSNVTMRTASFPGGNVVSWDDMIYYTNLTKSFKTSAIARFNWHQAFSSASYNEYPLEYNYAAFTPTHRIRSWGMVVNDDIATDTGVYNLVNTYAIAMTVWGKFVQVLPPDTPSSPNAYSPSYTSPYVHGPASSPSESTHGPSATVPLYVVIIIGIVAGLALIMAIVFAIKYSQMKKLVGDEGRARLLPYVT